MLSPDRLGDGSDETPEAGADPEPLLQELTTSLGDYREGMQRVEFLLESQLLFAGAGRDDRLGIIADLMDETAEQLTSLVHQRDIMVRAGWRQPPTLDQLAQWTPEPWSGLLRDHQEWLVGSLERVHQLVGQCRVAMQSTEQLTRSLTKLVTDAAAGERPAGNE